MAYQSVSFDPDSVASTSDVASSALAAAEAASDVASAASAAAAKGSDASSKIAAKSATWDKASAASSVAALKKAILYNTTPADAVDDGFTGSFVASGVLARGHLCYIKTTGAAAKANAASGATASALLVLSPKSVADTGSFAAIMPGTMVGHSAWAWSCGKPIFMGSSAGTMTQTKPSAASAIVRVVGYGGRNSNVMWFDPDKTWVEIA